MIEVNPLAKAKNHFFKQLCKGKLLSLRDIELNIETEIEIEEDCAIYHGLLRKWYKTITTLDFLPKDISNLEEIFIHGPTNIQIKTSKTKHCLDADITNEDLNIICDILIQKHGLDWNLKDPFVSFHSKINGSEVRISLIHHSASPLNQSKVFIRILNNSPYPLSIYKGDSDFYKQLIMKKKNILIAGPTGSGKTTFANSLLSLLPDDEHIIIIEDTKEIICNAKNTTRLVVDPKNENKSINSYLSYSLRMSPDRIILGEIRSKEAESSLLAMNTGHNGFISTIHANSAKDALNRLCLLFKMYSSKDLSFELVLKLITANIDYVVFIENKQVKEIIEVFGSADENIFFESLNV